MSKFSNKYIRIRPTAPVTAGPGRALTHEGAVGYAPDLESELFLMAATYMATEPTFYETAEAREARFVDLVHRVTASNPEFVARLAPYLRKDLKIRSASIMLAAEYVAAGGEGGRAVVRSVLQRGDEPAEMVGYWHSRYGRSMKMAVKRGVADGAARLYNERSALRYDGLGRGIRMADVIELTHPKPRDAKQSELFKWLLDKRHHNDAVADPNVLPVLAASTAQADIPTEERRAKLRADGADALAKAGTSWERLAGWLPGGMDAEAWDAVIPTMGVMALIRNLRNFDEQGISRRSVNTVLAKITDADEVAKARLFPYQVWAAYSNAPSDNWKAALGATLDLTTQNVPSLDRTLVVIDTSGSMQAPVSAKSTMRRVEVAAVMAAVTAARSTRTDTVIFGQYNKAVRFRKGVSTLGRVAQVSSLIGSVGHATFGHTAIRDHYDPTRHDRVVMFTDDQMADAGAVDISHVPVIYTVDLAGYRPRSTATRGVASVGGRGRYALAGFSDSTFTLMQTLEAGRNADWPF